MNTPPYLLAHLAGKEPFSGAQFNDGFLINHAFWEEVHDDEFKRLLYARTINSLPLEDQAQLARVSAGRERESLARLDFILTQSDCREDIVDYRDGATPRPALPVDRKSVV